MFRNWLEVLQTCNLDEAKKMDTVSRWLILVRACVFSMTLTSGLVGGLLAAQHTRDGRVDAFDWGPFLLSVAGIILAHTANNLMNDYFDMTGGVDTDAYTRALYAPHPVLSGMISKQRLLWAIVLVNTVNIAIGIVLTAICGWSVVVFAGLGIFISVFYVAPPLKLKHHGLGEPGVFLVWGPLMIGGVYFVTTGAISADVLVATVPYALLVTTVLMGKHIDKLEQDKARGIHTLPVALGHSKATRLTQAMMIVFYPVIIWLVLNKTLGVWALLVFLGLPRLWQVVKAFNQPKPAEPPPDYPVWPLWFVSLAFIHTRIAGFLFVAGLFLNLLLPISL